VTFLPHGNPRRAVPLGNFSRYLPELLNPSLKGYFEALTERDRFAQIDQALEPWDIWLTPAATPAFTHRPAWRR